MRWGRVRMTGGFALLWAALLYFDTGTLIWFWAAAVTHELGHLVTLKILGGRVERWDFTAAGISMEPDTSRLGYGAEAVVSLMGPAFGFAAAALCAFWAERSGWDKGYVLAGANLSLSLFNLLPAAALDGGRALWHLVCRVRGPERACRLDGILTGVTGACMAAAGIWLFWRSGYNITLLCIAGYILGGVVRRREGPCRAGT